MKINYLLLVFLILKTSIALGQLNASVIGNAFINGNNCYTITPDNLNQVGGVWYDNPLDFSSDFTIYYQNNFGNKDLTGADGMVLVFKGDPTPVLGNVGRGIGYEGIDTSMIVEFDTYQNLDLGDPSWDHIAIMSNGVANHVGASNLAGPVLASSASINIEDGNTHEVKLVWDATAQLFSVYFDCVLRLTLNSDIKASIFAGDSSVFFWICWFYGRF